ncbi:MAG: N-acetylglucosaminyldiphosphoundecaprenol N-acetyl-beta-D-mannosaminyltransferase [Cellvibrionaceae bacterium]|jgi:N-acetylglucosaminyldiphosphoundecaprenol N-acetyl-beta-D-mannosaminyltransferase
MGESLDRIDQFIQQGRIDGRTRQIATINADFVVKAAEDPELRFLLQESDMATADGMPLVWGARLLGVDIRERVAGADMVPALAKRAAQRGYSIYLFGSMEGVAEQAAKILIENNPGLNIVGTVSPPFSSIIDMDQKYIDDIKKAKPDILLVALGNPKQEKFIGMHKNGLGVPVAIGIGGTLDFIAGKTSRAPLWMQNSGIEWIYRMFSDPKRLVKRYYNDLVGFTRFFAMQWFHMRNGERPDVLLPQQDIVLVGDKAIVNLVGRVDMANNNNLSTLLEQALVETANIDIDLGQAVFLDSVAIGTILACTRIARDRNGDIRMVNVPATILKTLKLLKLDRFFELISGSDKDSQEVESAVLRTSQYIIIPTPPIFDANSSQEWTRKALPELESGKSVILDFSNTRLLASAGLAAMAKINHEVTKIGGDLKLTNCTDDIVRVFKLVKFDILFPIIDSWPE